MSGNSNVSQRRAQALKRMMKKVKLHNGPRAYDEVIRKNGIVLDKAVQEKSNRSLGFDRMGSPSSSIGVSRRGAGPVRDNSSGIGSGTEVAQLRARPPGLLPCHLNIRVLDKHPSEEHAAPLH